MRKETIICLQQLLSSRGGGRGAGGHTIKYLGGHTPISLRFPFIELKIGETDVRLVESLSNKFLTQNWQGILLLGGDVLLGMKVNNNLMNRSLRLAIY